ncbi:recombining binding protein suppressor of hairless [Sarotherodon galilaeus]
MVGWTSDWTLVRYGKRRGQSGVQAPYRGMARAPPASNWRRGPNLHPNRPAPPFGTSARYLGPQSRSYASVTRHRPFGSVAGPQRLNQGRQQQPTDPKFAKLVRQLHSVIKLVHHLQNVSQKPGKPEPVMISRMVENLSTMIKPACPNQKTKDLIEGNARNWGHTTLIILEDHYTAMLEDVLSELSGTLPSDWQTAFEVATRWAKKNLPRITQEVIDHAEALVTTCTEVEKDLETQPAPAPLDAEQQTEDAQQTSQQTRPQKQTQTRPPQAKTVTISIPQISKKQTVGTMTDGVSDWTPEPPQDEQAEPSVQAAPLMEHRDPRPQRQGRRARRGVVVQEDSFDFDIVDIGEDRQGATREQRPQPQLEPLGGEEDNRLDSTPPLIPTVVDTRPKPGNPNSVQVSAIVHQDPTAHQDSPDLEWSPLFDDGSGGDFTSTPMQFKNKVTRHINTDRKMVDWTLSVNKKWLIVGDSNLARIPPFTIRDLQIDSYPGGNFRHAQAFISTATSQVTVEKVVLAFGINCRLQKPKQTAIKQMQAAVRAAKRQFPYSEIWVPVINHSTLLSSEERTNLQILNGHIQRNLPFIPALDYKHFRTESDCVHWTKATARAMLDHWATYLNLNPR